MKQRTRKKLIMLSGMICLIMMLSTAQAQLPLPLMVDFNSTSQDDGPNPQAGWSAYDAAHEVAADFDTKDYGGITVTPTWPNTTDNHVQQMIDRTATYDASWDNSDGYIDLVTDWIGTDTRTDNGGNGDWDGVTGTPTYLDLALGNLPAGDYDWTSFHHDTERIWGPFAVWVSTDGGSTFTQLKDGVMTNGSTGGSPASPAVYSGPDPYTLPSTYRTSFTANGTDDVVMRFAAYAGIDTHRRFFHMNGFTLDISTGAHEPSPGDGAIGIADSGNVTLSWKTGMTEDPPGTVIVNPDITTHYLYMSNGSLSDPNLTLVATIPASGTTGSKTFADLGTDKEYYWSVEEGVYAGNSPGDPNNIPGPVWSFATVISVPIIDAQPTDQAGFPGGTATFTIAASSATPLTYTWYRSADTVIDASDTQVLTGINQDTLNVTLDADLATAVEAPPYYYCVLDNGNVVESAVVQLVVKRQIAYYKFDGNTNDSVAILPHDGSWFDPSKEQYTTGITGGSAAVFTGDPNDYIIVGASAAPSADPNVRGDLEGSISYWVKSSSTSFMSVMGSFNTGNNTGFQANLSEGTYGRISGYVRGGDTINVSYDLPEPTDLHNGQWHHIAVTWSQITDEGVLYLDGRILSTQAETGNPVLTPWEFPVTIGARNVRGVVGAFLNAELDDLQLYNYALSKTDVYDLYLAGPADWVCAEPTPEWITRYDVDGNCVVDLIDFAALAKEWLSCNRYPASECQ